MSQDKCPAISVVIPIFNCETFIDELLGGLSTQSFQDFEVICVNDGSTDNTLPLVQSFCKKDDRFSYISEENGGAGSARNAGLDIVKGKYVLFLDADDLYHQDLLKEMYDAAEKSQADIAICQYTMVDALRGDTADNLGLNHKELKAGNAISPSEVSNLFMVTNPAPTNKMYLVDFLKRINLRYKCTKIAQDVTFTYSALAMASKIVGVPKVLTTVRSGVNADSISSSRNINCMDQISALRNLFDWLKDHGIEDKYEETFLARTRNSVLWETNFQSDSDYIHAVANMIKSEEPWAHLPYKKRLSYWKFNLPAMEKKVEDLIKEIGEDGNSDQLTAQLNSAKNKLESARMLTSLLEKDSPKLSVVIPMYNCEEYVDSLLNDISNQTFRDFEVICVNDGSTDNTLPLIKAFCKKDDRFSYISKENGGAGSARNAGLDVASGKYMMFLDTDDIYFPDFFSEMYEAAEAHQADEVFCLYDEYNYKDKSERKGLGFSKKDFPANTPIATDSIEYLYGSISWSPWNALYKKELIDQYSLRFSTTKVANDFYFIYAYASLTKKIVGVHKVLLKRRKYHNTTSITSVRWKHTEDVISSLNKLYQWIRDKGLSPSYLEMCRLLFIYSMHYNMSFPYNEKYVQAVVKTICEGDMWKDIDSNTFYKKYWKNNDIGMIRKKILDCQMSEENVQVTAQEWSNRLAIVERIEEEAFRKYNRVLNPNSIYKDFLSIKKADQKLLKDNLNKEKKIESLSNKLKKSDAKVEKIKDSWNYKTGYYVTWLPKKLYYGVTGKNNKTSSPSSRIKVSVIIPVYKVEKYIKKCIDSLINQSLKEMEFIFVDDCGQDGSMAIIQEYQKKDSRIKILKNKKNLGAGPSRNAGIEIAKGEYLGFVDPDDWVSPNTYEQLYIIATKDHADIAKGNVLILDESDKEVAKRNYYFNLNCQVKCNDTP